jgi:hypothetical protein
MQSGREVDHSSPSSAEVNPWITEQKKKLPTFTELGRYCAHIF